MKKHAGYCCGFGGLSRLGKRRGQAGIATLLMILFVGIGLVSISAAMMYNLRSTQERQVAAHAQVNAQAGAWAAAEAVRTFLQTLDAGQLGALDTNATWTLTGVNGLTQTARVTGVTNSGLPSGSYRITAQITSVAASARASSVLEVVYEGSPATSVVTVPSRSVLNFYGGLHLTGGIEVYQDAGSTTPYEINVIGDVNVYSTFISGVDVIRSTGSVRLDGTTSFFNAIYANCDVRIRGGTIARTIEATHHVCLVNSSRSGFPSGVDQTNVDVRANGSVSAADTAGINSIFALAGKGGYSYCSTGAEKLCTTEINELGTGAQEPTASAVAGGVYGGQNLNVRLIRSNASIKMAGSATLRQLHAEQNVTLNWTPTIAEFVRYGGTLNHPGTSFYNNVFGANNSTGKDQKINNYTIPLEPVTPVSIETEKFDANSLRDYANYIFYIDSAGRKRVTIRNVINASGQAMDIENGFLANMDWVCSIASPVVSNDPSAATPARIGRGYNNANSTLLIGYTSGTKTWKLAGDSLAPGIAFFEGNLDVGSGTYFNTFLASGNIATSGSSVSYVPNYAGFSGIQNSTQYAPDGICKSSRFPNLVPTQFCKGNSYDASAIKGVGNYAMMAGSCGDTNCTKANYVGGNITTGASTNVYGAVKAGNIFVSSGNTTVHGYIMALAQGVVSSNHKMGAKTTIDLRNMQPHYDPTGGQTVPGGTTPGAAGNINLLWSRYL